MTFLLAAIAFRKGQKYNKHNTSWKQQVVLENHFIIGFLGPLLRNAQHRIQTSYLQLQIELYLLEGAVPIVLLLHCKSLENVCILYH